MNDPAATTQAPESMEEVIEDNHPTLLELDVGFHKMMNAIDTKESLTRKEWMGYYDKCYKLCTGTDRHEPGLYQHISSNFEKQVAFILREKLQDLREDPLLKKYLETFEIYRSSGRAIANTSHILARFWIPAQKAAKKDVREVQPLSLLVWREHCYATLKESLLAALFGFIERDRNGAKLDKSLIRDMIENLAVLGLDDSRKFYEREFEGRFLEETKSYYVNESTGFMASNSISDYMTKAEERIKEETGNCETFYAHFKDTQAKLEQALNWALIENHMESLQASFKSMLTSDRQQDMTRFYFLLSRVSDGLTNSAKTFEQHVASQGVEIVKEQASKKTAQAAMKSAISFIQRLIELYGKYSAQVEQCFLKNSLFKEALDKAFVTTMNMPSGKFTTSRLLNFHLDYLLKGKAKTSEEDKNATLEDISRLFSYFRDKDEFAEYARRGLCKRLLARGSGFDESAEKAFISLLKAQCGNAFTRRLQGMFTDAEDEATARVKHRFQEWNSDSDKVAGVQLSVQVLNDSYWPISGVDKFPIPGMSSEFVACVSKFEEYYKLESSSSKKLRWLYNHGTVLLATTEGKAKREVVVTPIQASVLLLFNQKDAWTFAEIKAALWPGAQSRAKLRTSRSSEFDINLEEILKAALQPLAFWSFTALERTNPAQSPAAELPKEKKSTKEGDEEGEGEEGGVAKDKINDDDTFTVKLDLKKKRRVTFPAGSAKQESKQAKQDQVAVIKQRAFEVDAAMVRVMKSRNVLSWTELQLQVVEILKVRFLPQAKLMKARLESLIERGFLDRDPNDRTTLKYIA